MLEPAEALQRLRQLRARRQPGEPIGPLVSAVAQRADRTQQRLGAFVDLWEALLPAEVSLRTRVSAMRGGVALVVADSSATAYELDRRLRGGLELELRRRYSGTLVRIRISVGEVARPGPR